MAAITIPYKPRPQQREIHDSLLRFNALVCHRRFGKTVLAINELIKDCLGNSLKRPRYHYVAPLYKQAKTIAWDYLREFSAPIPNVEFNQSELRADYPNGGRIQLLGADNPDAHRGIYSDGAVLDEISQFPPSFYGEVLRPALSDRKGWVMFIGTPKGHDHFYDIVQLAKRDPEWFCKIFRASETGIIDPAELKQAQAQMSEAEYQQEFECDFNISSAFILIPIQDIESAFDRRVSYHGHPRIMGMDVGMSLTGDTSAWVITQGKKVLEAGEFRLSDTFAIAGKFREVFLDHHCSQGYIDSIGYGAGVGHTLKSWGLPVTGINVAEKSPEDERFLNLRADLYWRAKDFWAEKDCSLPNTPVMQKLAAELSTPEYEYTPAGKIKIQSKKDLPYSPNLADAFVLTRNHATTTAEVHPEQIECAGGITIKFEHDPEPGLI